MTTTVVCCLCLTMHKKIIVGYVKVIIIYMSLSDYPVFDVDVVGSMVALLLAVI